MTLRALLRLQDRFGPGSAARKLSLLRRIEREALPTAAAVQRLHELLCFWRAYPDDGAVLERVERLLRRFAGRGDLGRVRGRLESTGIAGTDIVYPFGALTARWLAARWGERLSIDWEGIEDQERLSPVLILLALPAEVPGLDEAPRPPRAWLKRLRAPHRTDAAWLVQRMFGRLDDPLVRERVWDGLAVPLRLSAGEATPSRTLAKFPASPIVYQRAPLRRERPDLRAEAKRPPLGIRPVSPRVAEQLIDLARGSMVTRARDLDAFVWADPRDVRLVECGDGLQFACIGAEPDRRFLLEAVYGFLTLKNGVPIGYALASALAQFSEVAYNVFETFRGGEAAHVYGRLLGTIRALFGTEEFTIHPYQLGGDGNDEGLDSGAWWFYYKLGFRPRARAARALVAREAARVARDPSYRTPRSTLEQLVRHHVYLALGRRPEGSGAPRLDRVGLAVTRYVAARFGADRERAARVCADEAAALLGAGDWRQLPPGPRGAWAGWGPLVAVLPGVKRWGPDDRRALAEVIVAKGGVRESDFVARFDRHAKLRAAIVALARGTRS